MSKSTFTRGWTLVVAVVLLAVAVFEPASGQPVSAGSQATQQAIAYIRSNDVTGDEIRLVDPDGTNDRRVWRTGASGAQGVRDIANLVWRPNARELAFEGRHEEACSFYASDIYAIRPDGMGYRRVTAPPACGQGTGRPTGTVKVEFDNFIQPPTNGPFVLYVEGSPQAATFVIAPGDGLVVTFPNVADYGDGVAQWAVATTLTTESGVARYMSVHGHADVLPGQTVEADGPVEMSYAATNWRWHSPTWRSDDSEVAYMFGSAGTIYSKPADSTNPGGIGSYLLNLGSSYMPIGPLRLTWGPAGARANQLLYTAWSDGSAIIMVQEGSTNPGEVIVPAQGQLLGVTWLPDGSGFLYSEGEQFGEIANIFEYDFATGESARLTDFAQGWTRSMTISPNGQQIVFERQTSGDWMDGDPVTDLWIMNRDGSDQQLFVQDGRSPAWSLQPLPAPLLPRLFLPLLKR